MKADWLIRNAAIIDGTGAPAFSGDLAIGGGKILDVSEHIPVPADFPESRVIDAQGAVAAPGFVDIHRHGDFMAFTGKEDELLSRQGITSVVNGNCGLSVVPCGGPYREEILDFLSCVAGRIPSSEKGEVPVSDMHAYLAALSGVKRSVNTGMLVGSGTLRSGAAGYSEETLSDASYAEIHRRLCASLEAGALGVSLGLAYAPEFLYTTDSLVRALAPLQGSNAVLTVHIRNEGDGLLSSVREILEAAGRLRVPLHLSHMKCIGRRNWSRLSLRVMEEIRRAREEGQQVSMDTYPYVTGSTQLLHLLPPAFQKGGIREVMKALRDPGVRKQITEELEKPSLVYENIAELAGFENIFVPGLSSERFARYSGCSIREIAEREKYSSCHEILYDILLEEYCRVPMLDTFGCAEDLKLYLSDPQCALISDAIYPAGARVHPRVYAAFPFFLAEYVYKRHWFSEEEAIYKMTSLPARCLGIDRGILAKGKAADIVLFRPGALCAPADFQNPEQLCRGFDAVFIGGVLTVRNDEWKNSGSGKVLKGRGIRN